MIEHVLDSPYNTHNSYLKAYCYECGRVEYFEEGILHWDDLEEREFFFCSNLCVEALEIQKEIYKRKPGSI